MSLLVLKVGIPDHHPQLWNLLEMHLPGPFSDLQNQTLGMGTSP